MKNVVFYVSTAPLNTCKGRLIKFTTMTMMMIEEWEQYSTNDDLLITAAKNNDYLID